MNNLLFDQYKISYVRKYLTIGKELYHLDCPVFPTLNSLAEAKKKWGLTGDDVKIAKDLLEQAIRKACDELELDPVTFEDLPSVTEIEKFWRKYTDIGVRFLRRKPLTLDRKYAFAILSQSRCYAKMFEEAYNILAPIEGLGCFSELMDEYLNISNSPEQWAQFRSEQPAILELEEKERAKRKRAKEEKRLIREKARMDIENKQTMELEKQTN